MFWMPVFFHIYALATCIVMAISNAIPTMIVVTAIHCAYLDYVYKKLKKKISRRGLPEVQQNSSLSMTGSRLPATVGFPPMS